MRGFPIKEGDLDKDVSRKKKHFERFYAQGELVKKE